MLIVLWVVRRCTWGLLNYFPCPTPLNLFSYFEISLHLFSPSNQMYYFRWQSLNPVMLQQHLMKCLRIRSAEMRWPFEAFWMYSTTLCFDHLWKWCTYFLLYSEMANNLHQFILKPFIINKRRQINMFTRPQALFV